MKQMQINGQDARQSVCTEIKGGWSLLRTSDCAEGREYALRAHRKTDRTLRILEQTLYAMLEGLSVAVLVEDNTGRIAHMAMQAVKGQAPDCRLLARAGGTAFVALPEPDACRTVVGWRNCRMAVKMSGFGLPAIWARACRKSVSRACSRAARTWSCFTQAELVRSCGSARGGSI